MLKFEHFLSSDIDLLQCLLKLLENEGYCGFPSVVRALYLNYRHN